MDNSKKIGDTAEKKFEKICRTKNYEIMKANKEQNIREHWDYKVTGPNHQRLVDVKAAKKITRTDKAPSYDWTWIEIRNVRGDEGWIKGKADLIAFEQKDGFIVVERELLKDWCKENIDLKKYVFSPKDAKYNLYTRKKYGKKDIKKGW